MLDLLDVPADAPERCLWRRSVPALVSAIAKALPEAEACLEESDNELRELGYGVPERKQSKEQDATGELRLGDDVFTG